MRSCCSDYADWRESDRRRIVAFTDGLVRLFYVRRSGVLRGMRSVGLLAFDVLPPAKSAMARLSVGAAERVPRLARGVPLGRAHADGRATQDRFRCRHRGRRHGRHLPRGIDGTRRGCSRTGASRWSILSRRSKPDPGTVDLRVSALSRASERILGAARAWEPLLEHASPYRDMVVWDAASTATSADALHFSAAETAEPNLGHIVENWRVQWALHESPLLRGVTIVRSGLAELETRRRASARLQLADGRRLSCQLVVGADGSQSLARVLAGIGRSGWAYGQSAVVAHLQTEKPHRQTAWQRFLPRRSDRVPAAARRPGFARLEHQRRQRREALQAANADEFSERVSVASDLVLGQRHACQ